MKRSIPLILLILILTAGGAIVACSSTADHSQGAEDSQKEHILEIMRGITIDAWCIAIEDTQATRSLLDRFGNEASSEGAGLLEGVCRYLAIDLQEVTCSAQMYPFGPIYLLGQFNFDDMRAHLAEYGFHRSDREGIETWWEDANEDSEWGSTWVMMHGNLTIYGSDGGPGNEYSKYCRAPLTRDNASLYEDPDFRDIIDDFPSAVSYNLCRSNQQDYEGLKVFGALTIVNGETLTYMGVWEFTDSATATRSRDTLDDDLKETNEQIVHLVGPDASVELYQSNQYIVYSVEGRTDQMYPALTR